MSVKIEQLEKINKRYIVWLFASLEECVEAQRQFSTQSICDKGNGAGQEEDYDFGDGEAVIKKTDDKRFVEMTWTVDYKVSEDEMDEWKRLEARHKSAAENCKIIEDEFNEDDYGDWMNPAVFENIKTLNRDGSDSHGEAAEWGTKGETHNG